MTGAKDPRAAKKTAPSTRMSPQVEEVIRSIQQTERVIERLVFEKDISGPSAFTGTRRRTSK